MDADREKLKKALLVDKLRFAREWRKRFDQMGNHSIAIRALGLGGGTTYQWGVTSKHGVETPNIPGVFEHIVMCRAMQISPSVLAFGGTPAERVIAANPSLQEIIDAVAVVSSLDAALSERAPALPSRSEGELVLEGLKDHLAALVVESQEYAACKAAATLLRRLIALLPEQSKSDSQQGAPLENQEATASLFRDHQEA